MWTHHRSSSYLTGSVVSATGMKTEQSEQALYLHQALLHVLFCRSALKLMFPDQGHASCCFFRLMPLTQRFCPINEFDSSFIFFPPCQQGVTKNASCQFLTKSPFSAFLLPALSLAKQLLHSRMAYFQSFPFPKLQQWCMLS